MDDKFRQYGDALSKTQSGAKSDRAAGEAALRQMSQTPGFGIVALRFLTLDAVPIHLKQSSAVVFKNLVKDNWGSVVDSDKAQIKSIILPFLLSGPPPKLRSILGEAVSLLAQHDFPQAWPSLVGDLAGRLNTNDVNQRNGILRMAHSVFQRYRTITASADLGKELQFILDQFAKPLMVVYMQTWEQLQGSNAQALLLETLNLCCKVFYDLNCLDLPEFFENNMKDWMTGFLQAIKFSSNVEAVLGEDDRPGVLHKLKKNVFRCLTLYATKYDEEFQQYLDTFVQQTWVLLTDALKTSSPKTGAIVANGVAFLTAVANGAHHRLFANGEIMKSICQQIVIPCMMLSKDDVELFEDDPQEYVRQDIEGGDTDTRRRSAKELVKGLRKNYEQQVTEIFGSYIQNLLQQYKTNPKQNWRAKDVAVYLLTAVAVSTFRQATGANTINPMVPLIPFFQENVLCDLNTQANVHPVLQADALKFVITFRIQIPVQEYGRLIPAVVSMLRSPNWVIHTYAANAIDNMLTIKDSDSKGGVVLRITKEHLEGMLKDLLGPLFAVALANNKPNQYAMRAIMRVIGKSKEKIAPHVPLVLEGLSKFLHSVILNSQMPVFNHYLFEAIGALIGCAAIAGGYKAVGSLEGSLLPMFQSILQQDMQEFSGYVFQLMAQLLSEHTEGIPDMYWNLFPSFLTPLLWEKAGNVPALTRLLGQFVSKGAQRVASNDQWMQHYLGIWQHLNSTTKNDPQTFDLLGSLSDAMPLAVLDKYIGNILQLIFTRLSTPKGKTARYVKGFVSWLLQVAAKHGGSAILTRCNKVAPGIWNNCLGLIRESINKPRSIVDKKRCAVGAISLLCATGEMVSDPYLSQWGSLLGALMGLFELPEEDEPDDLAVPDEEITGGAVYTPLFHAGSLSEKDLYPDIKERIHLAKGLGVLSQKMGGNTVRGLVQNAIPPAAQQLLLGYCKDAGVNL